MCACVLFYFCSVELRSFLTFFFPEELCLSENALLCSPCFFFKSFYVYVFIDTTGNFLGFHFSFSHSPLSVDHAAALPPSPRSIGLNSDAHSIMHGVFIAWRFHIIFFVIAFET